MAMAIQKTIQKQSVIVAEAGTGTGKTFAYLVPAFLSGGKVIISTGTKTLQDQLFDRDIPTVRAALRAPVSVALLKGRSNYVCHHHLANAAVDGRLPTRDDARYLTRITAWAKNTQSGDKADLVDVPDSAGVWAHVTSTRDNCLGSSCEHFDNCFVMRARRQALSVSHREVRYGLRSISRSLMCAFLLRDGLRIGEGLVRDVLGRVQLERLYNAPVETITDANGNVAVLPG